MASLCTKNPGRLMVCSSRRHGPGRIPIRDRLSGIVDPRCLRGGPAAYNTQAMKELTDVLATRSGSRAERLAAREAFLTRRREIWEDIREGRFPATYTSADNRKFVGAPRRTA